MTTTQAAQPRLQVTGLSKRYGPVRALDSVELSVWPGETVALLGENGAGKSTLVKVLSGLVEPDSGEIRIDGQLRSFRTSRQSQDAGIAVVQQEYSSVPNLTVAENVFLGQAASPVVWRRRALARAAAPLLDRVGLGSLDPLTELRQLTVAERQLVEIARVLARDAQVLLFDEPTASLSDAEIVRVISVVRGLAAEGRSIIYVTHRLGEVFEVGDRVVVFRDGRNLPARAVRDVSTDEIITMMLGRKLAQLFPPRPPAGGEVLLSVTGLCAPGLADPVSLTVRSGQIVGLTGQMGSGAGLVVQALAARHPVTAGTVTVAGTPVTFAGRREGISKGVGFCSSDRQADGLFTGLSVQRNLSSPWLSSVSRKGVLSAPRERALAGTAAAGMAIDLGRLSSAASTLSGGNQQKVALGRWASADSRVLLVEEPTRGVDVGARAEIYLRLRAMCAQGTAILVASSDTAEIGGLCDVIGTFYRGRLTALRPHDEWTDESLLAQVMSGAAAPSPH